MYIAFGCKTTVKQPGALNLQSNRLIHRKYKINTGGNRTGLKLLSSLYDHLPSVTTKYSSVSPKLEEFIKKLKQDLEVRGVTRDPWNLARQVNVCTCSGLYNYLDS